MAGRGDETGRGFMRRQMRSGWNGVSKIREETWWRMMRDDAIGCLERKCAK